MHTFDTFESVQMSILLIVYQLNAHFFMFCTLLEGGGGIKSVQCGDGGGGGGSKQSTVGLQEGPGGGPISF